MATRRLRLGLLWRGPPQAWGGHCGRGVARRDFAFAARAAAPIPMQRVLVVAKTSRLEVMGFLADTRLAMRRIPESSRVRRLLDAHNAHTASLRNFLGALQRVAGSVKVISDVNARATLASMRTEEMDAVFTAGGDGTYLRTAAYSTHLREVPLVGVNTDPVRSRGHLCAFEMWEEGEEGEAAWVRDRLLRLVAGEFSWRARHRIRATIVDTEGKSSVLPHLALNEVFLSERDASRPSVLEISLSDSTSAMGVDALCQLQRRSETAQQLRTRRQGDPLVAALGWDDRQPDPHPVDSPEDGDPAMDSASASSPPHPTPADSFLRSSRLIHPADLASAVLEGAGRSPPDAGPKEGHSGGAASAGDTEGVQLPSPRTAPPAGPQATGPAGQGQGPCAHEELARALDSAAVNRPEEAAPADPGVNPQSEPPSAPPRAATQAGDDPGRQDTLAPGRVQRLAAQDRVARRVEGRRGPVVQRSSGALLSTGTGSTAWMQSALAVSTGHVERVLRAARCHRDRREVERITAALNAAVRYAPEDPLIHFLGACRGVAPSPTPTPLTPRSRCDQCASPCSRTGPRTGAWRKCGPPSPTRSAFAASGGTSTSPSTASCPTAFPTAGSPPSTCLPRPCCGRWRSTTTRPGARE